MEKVRGAGTGAHPPDRLQMCPMGHGGGLCVEIARP